MLFVAVLYIKPMENAEVFNKHRAWRLYFAEYYEKWRWDLLPYEHHSKPWDWIMNLSDEGIEKVYHYMVKRSEEGAYGMQILHEIWMEAGNLEG